MSHAGSEIAKSLLPEPSVSRARISIPRPAFGWFRGLGGGCADDFQQLDLEDEGGAARNGRTSTISVGKVRWTNQGGLPSDLHLLDALGPTGDDSAERELRGFVPAIGAVELSPVHESAAVVDLDRIGSFGGGAGTGPQLSIDQPGFSLDGAWLHGGLGEIGLGGGLLPLRHAANARLSKRLNLRSPRVQVQGRLAGRGVRQSPLDDFEFAGRQVELRKGGIHGEAQGVKGLLLVGGQCRHGGGGGFATAGLGAAGLAAAGFTAAGFGLAV